MTHKQVNRSTDDSDRGSTLRAFSLRGVTSDLRYALRMIKKSPALAAVVVATLALGIGLNSAVFSVVNSILLRPLPVADEEELVRVFSQEPDGFLSHEPMSYPDFVDLGQQSRTFAGTAGFAMSFVAIVDDRDESSLTFSEIATGNYFDVLGVRPAMGRVLQVADDDRGDPQFVCVLSYAAWRNRFGGDPQIVGREIVVNGRPLTVVGVAPRGFHGLLRGVRPELWIPITTADRIDSSPSTNSGRSSAGLERVDDRGLRWLWVVARRAPGATFRDTVTELETLGARLRASYPESNQDRSLAALPLRDVKILPSFDGQVVAGSFVLMAVVGLVLLIASFNLANLLLARAMSRRREMATRLSLGASRARVVRQLLVESLVLALAGGLAGLLFAGVSSALLSRLRLPMAVPLSIEIGLDARVVVFTFAIATLTALVFGLAPALEAARTDLATVLRDESAGSGGHRWRIRLQRSLVVAQVTFSLLLLIFAGLSVRSLLNANRIDLGVETDAVIAATLSPDLQGYDSSTVADLYRRLEEEISAVPGVVSVSLPSHLPLTLWINTWSVVPATQRSLPEKEWPEVDTAAVDSSYFATLGVRTLRGRTFDEVENRDRRRVAVVNETMAEKLWPGEDALGQLLATGPESDPYEVIGIVANGKYRTLGEAPRSFLYTPISPDWTTRTVVARFDRPDRASAAAVRAAIQRIDAHLAISNLAPVEEVMSLALLLPRAGAVLFGLFGLLGVALAAIGLYGVLAYMVGERTHEIGIRVAIGASRGEILTMVARDGLILTAIGTVLGLGLAFASARVLGAILYGVAPHDLVTFVTVAAFLIVVALVASYLPARRATRVDPIQALRSV